MLRTKIIISAIIISALLLGGVLIINLRQPTYVTPVIKEEVPPIKTHSFAAIDVEARAVVVKDINTNTVIFAKNETTSLPLASITKIMTVYAADTLLNNTPSITISNNALTTYGEYGFASGEVWPTKELEAYTLIVSSNDGAVALAEAAGSTQTSSTDPNARSSAFVSYMNKLAYDMGLRSTQFKNPSGLDTALNEPEAFGSALDVANLFQHIIKKDPSILEPSVEVRDVFNVNGKIYQAKNTNDIVGTIPSLIASKTGYTDAAGGNLAVVYDSGLNRPVIIVVLGSSKEGRFNDMARLISYTQKYFEEAELVPTATQDVASN